MYFTYLNFVTGIPTTVTTPKWRLTNESNHLINVHTTIITGIQIIIPYYSNLRVYHRPIIIYTTMVRWFTYVRFMRESRINLEQFNVILN